MALAAQSSGHCHVRCCGETERWIAPAATAASDPDRTLLGPRRPAIAHRQLKTADESGALTNLKLSTSASIGSPGGRPERGGNGDKLGGVERPTWQTAIR